MWPYCSCWCRCVVTAQGEAGLCCCQLREFGAEAWHCHTVKSICWIHHPLGSVSQDNSNSSSKCNSPSSDKENSSDDKDKSPKKWTPPKVGHSFWIICIFFSCIVLVLQQSLISIWIVCSLTSEFTSVCSGDEHQSLSQCHLQCQHRRVCDKTKRKHSARYFCSVALTILNRLLGTLHKTKDIASFWWELKLQFVSLNYSPAPNPTSLSP